MKLYRFRTSAFARKTQILLELLGLEHEVIDVQYADRSELARLTGGYIFVPVLVDRRGQVTVDSRRICELLLADDGARWLAPPPLEGPIWAYADFCDGPLEDVMFKIASPAARDSWQDPGARALYVLVKERKFGAGCVDQWARDREALLDRARLLLGPTLRTLRAVPFLFGDSPTLADAALYGNLIALHEVEPALVAALAPELRAFMTRLEQRVAAARRASRQG